MMEVEVLENEGNTYLERAEKLFTEWKTDMGKIDIEGLIRMWTIAGATEEAARQWVECKAKVVSSLYEEWEEDWNLEDEKADFVREIADRKEAIANGVDTGPHPNPLP